MGEQNVFYRHEHDHEADADEDIDSIDSIIREMEMMTDDGVNCDEDDARIDDVFDFINDDHDSCSTPAHPPISSRVPVVTRSDIDDYSRRNNNVVSNNPKRRKRKRKPGVKESKRKSIVANKRPRVGGRF